VSQHLSRHMTYFCLLLSHANPSLTASNVKIAPTHTTRARGRTHTHTHNKHTQPYQTNRRNDKRYVPRYECLCKEKKIMCTISALRRSNGCSHASSFTASILLYCLFFLANTQEKKRKEAVKDLSPSFFTASFFF
jgi:hypothetical protein